MPKYDARQEIEDIKIKLGNIETLLDEVLKNHLPHIDAKLDFLTKQVAGRPSWTVLEIIAFLATLSGILLTIVLRR